MTTIPVNMDVNIVPGVLSAGGTALALNGLILSDSTRVPIGSVQSFANALEVSDYFGPSSDEYEAATTYFNGYNNSFVKPGSLLMAQYPTENVAAFLRGGDVRTMTVAELAGLSGTLSIVIDGYYTWSAGSVNLSAATSYSDAADIIETALTASPPAGGTSTASTISGTTLTVGGSVTGTFRVGQRISGSGVTAGTKITALGTGTGGTGTYTIDTSQTVGVGTAINSFGATPTVTYDSTSGGFLVQSSNVGSPVSQMAFATGTIAAGIKLTSATGAVRSQGADAAEDPGAFMNGIIAVTQNWATFMTLFDPDAPGKNDVKMEFADWTNDQNNRYAYVCWDTDESPTTSSNAPSSMGRLLADGDFSGTILVWNTSELAAFVCGAAASIDFNRTNGRATLKFKSQSGMTATVTDQTVAQNLIDNGYNFYGAFATAADQFNYFSPGSVSGPFAWADTYLNQVWFNASLQLSLITLLTSVGAVPYTTVGYTMIEAAMADPIAAGLNFGAFSPGVPLSQLQQAEVNYQAGRDIVNTLFSQGYYVLIQPATAQVRAARTSPTITLWYCDAGAVHKITVASIAVQ